MLRAGIAIASTTREEKGQSWLSKRESSTSLVSETPFDDALPPHHRHHHRTRSGASSRKSRSGASTPAAYSRRSSRSRGTSRHGSRAGLAMTTIPPLSTVSGKMHSPITTGAVTPETRGRSGEAGLVPDFVDERIRAEMASLQQGDFDHDNDQDQDRHLKSFDDDLGDEEDDFDSEDEFSDETQEEFDEADLQRLTRERGFGLGNWIDRLVEWTLFGVDELPVVPAVPVSSARIGGAATTTTVTFEEPAASSHGDPSEDHDTLSLASEGDRNSLSDDVDNFSHTDGESTVDVEKPGSHGGWEDAGWLFRVMKRALV